MAKENDQLGLDTSHYIAGWRLYVVIACLFFGSFLIALDTNIINVALPQISSDFEALQDVAWYGSAYLLTLTAFQPVYGSWYKHFDTDVVYRLAIFVFEVGSTLCAAAVNSEMFIVGRAIAGFGAAGVLQGALSIISQVVPLEKRPFYMGIVISVFVIAVTVGPVLGGVFTERVTWRWCFWINLPIGVIVLAGLTIFLKIKGTRNKHRSLTVAQKLNMMDPLGCVLFISSVTCLLLALQWGGQSKPWKSSDVIGCLVGSVTIGGLFVYWERRRGEKALITLRVLRKRSIWTGAMVLFFLGAQTYLNVFFLPFWFQAVLGVSPITTGVDFIPLLLSQLIALISVGAIVKQWGYYVPYMVVGELVAVGGQAMLTQLKPDTSTVYWAASLVITGIGSGMAMQLPYTAVALVLSDDDIPVGNAIAVLFYQLGGAIFISMGQTITITTLLGQLAQRLPALPTDLVVTAGAANLPALVSTPEDLSILRFIWNLAVSRTMILATAITAASLPFTLGMDWLNAIQVAEARKKVSEEGQQTMGDKPGADISPTVTAVPSDKA